MYDSLLVAAKEESDEKIALERSLLQEQEEKQEAREEQVRLTSQLQTKEFEAASLQDQLKACQTSCEAEMTSMQQRHETAVGRLIE